MTRDDARKIILDMYKNRKAGDIKAMVAHAHPESFYRMNASLAPLADAFKQPKGRANMEQVLGTLQKEFVFADDWTEKQFLHQGDTSVLLWEGTVTASATGQRHHFDVVTVIAWKEDMIESVTDHTDTMAIAAMVTK